MPDSAVLTMNRCSAGYASRTVFERVDLSLGPGEVLAVVGASGSGKTTLLHVLGGLKRPSEGSVSFDGTPLRGPRPDIGIVFQDHSLFPWMTISRNVEVGLRVRRLAEPRRRAAAMLERLGIAECAASYPGEVSGGQRQRAALARTLVLEPTVVLLDEPFSSLDALTRERLQELTRHQLATDRLSGVIVTHDTEEAVFLGSVLGVLGGEPTATLRFMENPARGEERTAPRFVETRRRLRAMLSEVSRATLG